MASRFTQVYRELDHYWNAEAPSRLKKAATNLMIVDRHQTRSAIVVA